MATRTKTFTVTREYNYFEPGTRVQATEGMLFLKPGGWIVERTVEPICALDEDSTVFVEGYKYGISGHYFREVTT